MLSRVVFVLRDIQHLVLKKHQGTRNLTRGSRSFTACPADSFGPARARPGRRGGAAMSCAKGRSKMNGVTCEHVWGEISNYIDGEVEPICELSMEEHIH